MRGSTPRFMRGRRLLAGAVATVTVVLAAAACAGRWERGDAVIGGEAPDFPVRALHIMAPASPGGGWDQTSRTAQSVLTSGIIEQRVEVFNVPGAGGTVGLTQLVNDFGDGHKLMTMGLVMIGAIEANQSAVKLDQVTPIARLTSEYEVVVVAADSKYQTLADLVADLQIDPGKVPIAGGSAGGTDHILAGMIAKAAGVDPGQVNYVAFSGGGDALAAILGGKVAAGISGVAEFAEQVRAGKLRALAVSSPSRVASLDAPTLREGGVDVELANWRGMVAPPGISQAERAGLIRILTEMHESRAWRAALIKNGWDDTFIAGDEFAAFLATEQNRVLDVVTDLGLK